MIVMLDTSHDLDVCAEELRHPVEQLLTPLTRFTNKRPENHFAIDNGAYSKFNRQGFEALLEREKERRHLCRFVSVPDVVGSARRTLEVFDYWFPLICQWPLALVAQDGQEGLPIEWEHLAAIFIGGTTPWKMSGHVEQIIKAAKAMGKHVHVGRVNEPGRFKHFKDLGVDSIDGSGISQYSHMRLAIGAMDDPPPSLFGCNGQATVVEI